MKNNHCNRIIISLFTFFYTSISLPETARGANTYYKTTDDCYTCLACNPNAYYCAKEYKPAKIKKQAISGDDVVEEGGGVAV